MTITHAKWAKSIRIVFYKGVPKVVSVSGRHCSCFERNEQIFRFAIAKRVGSGHSKEIADRIERMTAMYKNKQRNKYEEMGQ